MNPNNQSQQQTTLLQKLSLGILAAVEAGGTVGAPSGILFAAMQAHGATIRQFNVFMDTFVSKGLIAASGNCYYITDGGMQLKQALQQQVR